MTVAELFRETRRTFGLNQVQMARRLGITQGWLSKIENGVVPQGMNTFVRLYGLANSAPFDAWHVMEGFLAKPEMGSGRRRKGRRKRV